MKDSAWGLNLKPAICEACDWQYLLPDGSLPQQCPYCFKGMLVPLEAEESNLSADYTPELVLLFTASPDSLTPNIQRFAGGIWFAPGDLNPQNLKARLQPVYWPMWLVDRQVQAIWQTEAGFNYDVVSHREAFSQGGGGWRSQQVTETRVRWEPRVGRLNRTYHNIPAPAMEDHGRLTRHLGPYNLDAAQPYQPQAISQTAVSLPNRSPADAWPDVMPVLQSKAAKECQKAAGADHIRNFRWSANYQHQNWTLLLQPMYGTFYLDDEGPPQPVLIHGQTGQINGPRRASMNRARRMAMMILVIAAIIFTLSGLVAIASFFVPPLFVPAGLGVAVAIMVGLLAIAPVVIAWQFNRTNQ